MERNSPTEREATLCRAWYQSASFRPDPLELQYLLQQSIFILGTWQESAEEKVAVNLVIRSGSLRSSGDGKEQGIAKSDYLAIMALNLVKQVSRPRCRANLQTQSPPLSRVLVSI